MKRLLVRVTAVVLLGMPGAVEAQVSPGEDPVVLLKQALLAEKSGWIDDACTAYTRVLELIPGDAFARAALERCGCLSGSSGAAKEEGLGPGENLTSVVVAIEQVGDNCTFSHGPMMDLVVTHSGSVCSIQRRNYFDVRFPCGRVAPGKHVVGVTGSIGTVQISTVTKQVELGMHEALIELVARCQRRNGGIQYWLEIR